MFLWRISNYANLDGQGGLVAPGRWHSRGHAIVYLADSPAGALLEVLVHLELDAAALPTNYGLMKIDVPGGIAMRSILTSDLPKDWLKNELSTRSLGDRWLGNLDTALLRVPSVIVPETHNVLLNPAHPDAARLCIVWHERYPWDVRLLQ